MSVNHLIDLNLTSFGVPPVVHMVQGDNGGSRNIVATLYDGSVAWEVPTEASVMFRYRKENGLGGMYNEDERNNIIFVDGSKVTIPIAAAVLSIGGKVKAEVDIYLNNSESKLAAFPFTIECEKSAYADGDIADSEYYNGEFQGPPGRQGDKGDTGAQGEQGPAATIEIGTVTTGDPGTQASVTNRGTSGAAILDFVIPKGETGQSGSGTGDMVSSVYDPSGKAKPVAFDDELSNVAKSGSYNDLFNKPTIPTKVSDLNNDSNYVDTNDSRLSDARTPTAHNHSADDISSGTLPDSRIASAETWNEKQTKITSSGILKGDGSGGVSQAIENEDYLAVPSGGEVGNVLKKTATGTEWGTASSGDMTEAQVNAKLGRTTSVGDSDTNYTTYMARGIAIFNDTTNPTVNGTIALRYH